jgi:hypothetical protein
MAARQKAGRHLSSRLIKLAIRHLKVWHMAVLYMKTTCHAACETLLTPHYGRLDVHRYSVRWMRAYFWDVEKYSQMFIFSQYTA